MLIKGCPRCRGDVVLAEDIGDRYLSCIQCGFLTNTPLMALAVPIEAGRIDR